ncbi:MAG TPA: hypothetical protein VNN80_00915 [Polyangiaceae bacterium]|jgi:hypothetical protein|nr:hypothetical protein [Polyangiaceae bacterium]
MTDFSHNDEEHPRHSPHHDLLIINPDGVLHRLQVEKRENHPNEGRYLSAPAVAHYREPGHRKVFNIAHAHAFTDARLELVEDAPAVVGDHGPAFAMLPVKPEPASSNWACYLINAQRLAYKNPWTQAAWNDEPDSTEAGNGGAQRAEAPASSDFELLVAGPAGNVVLVRSLGSSHSVTPVDLSQEQDIWSLLRNGCVVGTAEYYNHPDGAPKVVPLVNAACMVAPRGGR